jgi:hypothetical protein
VPAWRSPSAALGTAEAPQARPGTQAEDGGDGRHSGGWPVWAGVALASLAAWAALTWPLAVQMDRIWTVAAPPDRGGGPATPYRPGTLLGGDNLQNAFIQSVMVDNLRQLRNPYLDLREGAAGPAPLKTTSLDVPWTPVVAVLWPLAGLQTAYNATLALSSVATGLAAFGWLRRHTRWPLLAAAGALVYACVPHRIFQLTVHFNAVMWWAFPAALWAFETMLERHRDGRRWRGPAAALAAATATVALSGEFHLILYLIGLLAFLGAWWLVAALTGRGRRVRGHPAGARPPVRVPWGPLATVAASLAVACAYTLTAFAVVFRGEVQGGNGTYRQVLHYAPGSALSLTERDHTGEQLIYVGWVVVGLAAAGLVAALAGRGRLRAARPYAVLLVPLLFLSLGPAADIGPVRPYRFLFDRLWFLSWQRVPQRLMVVTTLVLVLLAVCALDRAGERLPAVGPRVARLAAAGLVAGAVLLLHDYQVGANVLMPDVAGNRVAAALRAAGDRAGPIVGVPVRQPASPRNSVTTYLAALSRRRALNAYNQTPAPWLSERLRRLAPLNRGQADEDALEVLRVTGTTQLVVVNEPRALEPGQWRSTIDALVASGRFRLVATDGPLALLEVTEP